MLWCLATLRSTSPAPSRSIRCLRVPRHRRRNATRRSALCSSPRERHWPPPPRVRPVAIKEGRGGRRQCRQPLDRSPLSPAKFLHTHRVSSRALDIQTQFRIRAPAPPRHPIPSPRLSPPVLPHLPPPL